MDKVRKYSTQEFAYQVEQVSAGNLKDHVFCKRMNFEKQSCKLTSKEQRDRNGKIT